LAYIDSKYVEQSVNRWATGWTTGVSILAGAGNFSLFHSIQPGSRNHMASYTKDTGAVSPGLKQSGLEAKHSPSPSAEVKCGGAIPPLPDMSLWHSA
jgi:hypothetical protein